MEIFPSGAVSGDTMRIVSRLSVSAARRSKHLDYVMRKHLRTQQYTRHVKQWYSLAGYTRQPCCDLYYSELHAIGENEISIPITYVAFLSSARL